MMMNLLSKIWIWKAMALQYISYICNDVEHYKEEQNRRHPEMTQIIWCEEDATINNICWK